MNKRRLLALMVTAILVVTCLGGCGKKKEEVQLSIWVEERYYELLTAQLEEFKELYKDEAEFTFNISFEGEDTCKAMILANPDSAADIFTFADDQFEDLYQAGVLLEVTENTDAIIASVGGADTTAAGAVTRDGNVYAYPATAGNGYFLYYNKSYFTENDLKTMDSILEVCDRNGKIFAMNYSSGWYIYSFFKGAGMDVHLAEDRVSNYCNWNEVNGVISGVDVANAMMDISAHESFANYDDDKFVEGVKNGTVIAGVNGQWNAETVNAAWGDDYGAVMLPTYTVNDLQVQMYSFMGYKMVGINANTASPSWAMKLAEFLTNEENQVRRFELTGECPANIAAAENPEVKGSEAVNAIINQSRYSTTQSVADGFWDPSSRLGIILASGNKDGVVMQEYLDEIVDEIEK